MKVFSDYKKLSDLETDSRIVSIGNFDGVHLGHKKVLRAAKEEAIRCGVELAVLTFDPHPAQFLFPDKRTLRLCTVQRKLELIEDCGVDVVLMQKFDTEFSSMDATDFASKVLSSALNAKQVQIGDNFRFGRERRGDIKLLKELGKKLQFSVMGRSLVKVEGNTVSSSWIRELLDSGDVAFAARLLGRPHEVNGKIVKGRGKGREFDFPTINFSEMTEMVPGNGIYAAFCSVRDKRFVAAAYAGERPTLGHGQSLEAHLIDFRGDLYGESATLQFIERIRRDKKFENTDKLKKQIEKDVSAVQTLLGSSA